MANTSTKSLVSLISKMHIILANGCYEDRREFFNILLLQVLIKSMSHAFDDSCNRDGYKPAERLLSDHLAGMERDFVFQVYDNKALEADLQSLSGLLNNVINYRKRYKSSIIKHRPDSYLPVLE